jgi:hypothetical protein
MIDQEPSRRRILQIAAAAVAATVLPTVRPDEAHGAILGARDTLDAFADTIVPGARRFAGDRVVLGAAPGPGAVQAGSWEMYNDPDVGLAALLPALAAVLDAQAVAYAATHGGLLGRGIPSFVALDLPGRTAVARKLVEGSGPDQLLWYAMAAMPMLAFHTAGHLDTATALREGHPGLAWLRFPEPDADGIWQFRDFSYRRALAKRHPRTTKTGQPA